jgi:hypothetical protein
VRFIGAHNMHFLVPKRSYNQDMSDANDAKVDRWRRLRARLRSFSKARYLDDGGIIRRYASFRPFGAIRAVEIRRWTVEPEMIFDIEEREGRIVRWLDYDGELIRLLESAAPAGRAPFRPSSA